MTIDRDTAALFALIREYLYPQKKENYDYTDVDWERIVAFAGAHRLTAIVAAVLEKKADTYAIPEEVLANAVSTMKNVKKAEMLKFMCLKRLIETLRERQLFAIVFKGCVINDVYPEYTVRNTSDTDILVKEEQKESVVQTILELGYKKQEAESKEKVYVFYHGQFGHAIEMHLSLWEDYQGKKIDQLEQMELTREDTLIQFPVKNNSLTVTTMEHTRHLIYQMFHIIKHFSVEGIGVRYLLDIVLFINRYQEEIDFPYFWKCMKEIGYDQFCERFFELGTQLLCMENIFQKKNSERNSGLDIEKSGTDPMVTQELSEDCVYLLYDLMRKGNMENQSAANGNFQILGIMTPYFVGEQAAAESKKGRVIQMLFPSAENIREDFSYAKRHHILLPIAWVHRMIDYAVFRLLHKNKTYGVNEKIEIANYRISMLDRYHLIDKDN